MNDISHSRSHQVDNQKITVTIIIPVRNGIKWLKESIPIFLTQKINGEIELLLLDSGSTDGLKDYINSINNKNISIYSIEPSTFNHGSTRNQGVLLSNGEFIIFTVQDAKPTNEYWVESFIKGFEDSNIVAICGKQIVPKSIDKNPVEWDKPINSPSIRKISLTKEIYDRFNPSEKRKVTGWDNVNACYRRSILLQYPFPEIQFGEDAAWAQLIIRNNLTIAYSSYPQVEHYHHYNINAGINRQIAEYFMIDSIYGIKPKRPRINIRYLLSCFKTILLTKMSLSYKFYWIIYNINIYISKMRAYKTYIGFSNNEEATQFLLLNKSQSKKSGR